MTSIHRSFQYGAFLMIAAFMVIASQAGYVEPKDAAVQLDEPSTMILTKDDEREELSSREKRESAEPGLYKVSSSGLIHGSENLELERYRERVKILHHMLREECPVDLLRRNRNQVSPQIEAAYEEIERLLFERMVRMLIECRQLEEGAPATNTTPTNTTPTTTTPTTTTTTTPPPSECLTATNLTEYWRKDHTGQQVGGSSNCDTRDMRSSGRPWFRFSGAAGNQLLNTCPPPNSCGTRAGIWSNETMPSWVGQSLNITAYGSWNSVCTQFPEPVTVLRCSTQPGDYIYRYNGDRSCTLGFCGMD